MTARANYALHLAYAGYHDEARAVMEKVLELQPDYPSMHMQLGRVLLAEGQPEEALALMQAEPHDFYRSFGLALAYHAVSNQVAADRELADFTARYQDHSAYQVAEIHSFRGEREQAFQWLDMAWQQHDGGLAELKGDPLLSDLMDDPRWAALLTRMGLPL